MTGPRACGWVSHSPSDCTGPSLPVADGTPLAAGPSLPVADGTPLTAGPSLPVADNTPLAAGPSLPVADGTPLAASSTCAQRPPRNTGTDQLM